MTSLLNEMYYTGCIKKCPKYKIASKLDIWKITDSNNNQKLK